MKRQLYICDFKGTKIPKLLLHIWVQTWTLGSDLVFLVPSVLDSSVAEDKWLSALEGTRWLDYVRSCLRKASDISVLVTSRVRSVVLQGEFLEPAPSIPYLCPSCDWMVWKGASLCPFSTSIFL